MVRIIIRFLAFLWASAVFILMGMWGLVYFGFFPEHSKWIALGFFPPFWFNLMLLPPFVVFWVQKYRKFWKLILGVYLVFFLSCGDLSYIRKAAFQFSEGERNQKLSIVTLNLQYFSHGFDNVVNAINAINADIYLLSENDITKEQIQEMKKRVLPKTFHMGRNEGTAIISSYPVLSFREIEFPTRQTSLNKGNDEEEMHQNPTVLLYMQ